MPIFFDDAKQILNFMQKTSKIVPVLAHVFEIGVNFLTPFDPWGHQSCCGSGAARGFLVNLHES